MPSPLIAYANSDEIGERREPHYTKLGGVRKFAEQPSFLKTFVSVKVFGGILFRNPAVEPHTIRTLVDVFFGVSENDLETPSTDPRRVFFFV